MIIKSIVSSFLDFRAACLDAWRGRHHKPVMSDTYHGWLRDEEERAYAHTMRIAYPSARSVTDSNTNVAANQNGKLWLVSTCWK